MKKWIILAFISFTALNTSFLQAQEFKGAISGGITSSQIGGDELSGFSKWGFYVGPKVTYPLTDFTSLGLQLLYTRKGSRRDNDEIRLFRGPWDRARYDYIDVPVFLQFHVKEKFSLHGGLYGGVLINAQSNSVDIEAEDFKRIDFGGLVGLNYDLSDRWVLAFRFSHSILPFDKSSNRPIVNFRVRGFFHSNLLFGLNYSLGR